MGGERLLDSKATADLLGCTESALALWRKRHYGPSYIRVGPRLVRYRQQDLFTWLELRRVDSGEPTRDNRTFTRASGSKQFSNPQTVTVNRGDQ